MGLTKQESILLLGGATLVLRESYGIEALNDIEASKIEEVLVQEFAGMSLEEALAQPNPEKIGEKVDKTAKELLIDLVTRLKVEAGVVY